MAQLQTKWIADDAVNDLKLKLRNDQPLRARNAADDGDVELFRIDGSDDLVLKAGAKIGANAIATVNEIPSTFNIQGNWNASTNTPTLVNGVNGTGDDFPLYIVSVGGSTTLDGQSDWVAGDKVYFANGQWWKADNNDAVASVNGETGAVMLDTDDIDEGAANLYHTDARARTAAVVNSTAGNETDQAASVDAMKSFVASQVGASSQDFRTESFTLIAGDITNGYVDLTDAPIEGSLVVFVKGSLPQVAGDDFEIDGVNPDRLNFLGDLAALLEAGDKLVVTYAY